ncbi:MAG TPA: metal-dependent hydrolase, partial [Candidatus Aminicenantes bacterium]|nr:metal-dependent hydrolase [Candidatus Aminicenantes bacterium]
AGDTALTYDMKLLKDCSIDYAFLPIGGNFTMDVEDALKAAEMFRPKVVMPVHYNTFEVIEASPEEFVKKVKDRGMEGLYLKPGEEKEL